MFCSESSTHAKLCFIKYKIFFIFLNISNFSYTIAVGVLLHASQGSPNFQKKCIYTLTRKILYTKLTYCNYPNENFEHLDLRITKFWV